jgi:SAM-dependent methyltransferase
MAFELPYPDASFDRVISSLLFHHLTREKKERTLKEIFRVLRQGGELHVADWGKAQNKLMRTAFLLVQMLDGFETTVDNVSGLLPELFRSAGFEDIQEPTRYMTIVGTLSLYRARKPA